MASYLGPTTSAGVYTTFTSSDGKILSLGAELVGIIVAFIIRGPQFEYHLVKSYF